ncbi:hypothetical protein SUGI_0862790 [Cryptomeria japonica]|nr:hypothetical protein SUGI_0862790 [Cryptomeria japonica]
MGYKFNLGAKGFWTGRNCRTALQTLILLLIAYLTKSNREVKHDIDAETANLGTNESSQANKSTRSHSGKQKIFVRQLDGDLTNLGVSCFFDEDPQSLPMGKDFLPRIFEAAETCRLAVLVLSQEFWETKWPMLETSTFVKARDKNPISKFYPCTL